MRGGEFANAMDFLLIVGSECEFDANWINAGREVTVSESAGDYNDVPCYAVASVEPFNAIGIEREVPQVAADRSPFVPFSQTELTDGRFV